MVSSLPPALPATRPDPLGQALYALRMNGTFYCRSELTEPWGLAMPPFEGCLWFHVVTSGVCTLEVGGAPPQRLAPGDFALVPHGQGHRLYTAPDVPCPAVDTLPQEMPSERYSLLRHGGGGAATTLVCGVVAFDTSRAGDLLALLPEIIHIDASSLAHWEWMPSMLRFMGDEAKALRPGGETLITRLSDILVIQAIRLWLERDPGARTGWIGALQDPQIGHAILLVHHEPARDWSVASLAAEVAMSRSAFTARFTQLVGESPMAHVRRVQMQVALAHLRDRTSTVGKLADRFGYQSEAAFRRAFKRILGVAPGAVRRGPPPPPSEAQLEEGASGGK
jgi:AraC-like DNA-binding protein